MSEWWAVGCGGMGAIWALGRMGVLDGSEVIGELVLGV